MLLPAILTIIMRGVISPIFLNIKALLICRSWERCKIYVYIYPFWNANKRINMNQGAHVDKTCPKKWLPTEGWRLIRRVNWGYRPRGCRATIQHLKEGHAVWWRSFFPVVTPLRESPRRQPHGSTLMSQRGRHMDMRVTTESTFAQQGWENNGMGMAQGSIGSPERVFHLKWGVKVLGAFHYQIAQTSKGTQESVGGLVPTDLHSLAENNSSKLLFCSRGG